MSRTSVTIPTADGSCPASLFRPAGDGPWPAVLMYMDGVGMRPALFPIAERIAGAGYLVLLPDLFYRAGPYQAPDAKSLFRIRRRARPSGRSDPRPAPPTSCATRLHFSTISARSPTCAPGR